LGSDFIENFPFASATVPLTKLESLGESKQTVAFIIGAFDSSRTLPVKTCEYAVYDEKKASTKITFLILFISLILSSAF
jgi:hypothetical protein